jgi:hypothetical protein
MRTVWSFWSRPHQAGTGPGWREPVHHLLAWGLSVRLASAHYPDTMLVTDTPGRSLLVEELGLPFGEVSTALDDLADADPRLWALGKLVAYGMQDGPFVHLDTDVFLWRPLPPALVTAPAFAQHPEELAVSRPGGPLAIEAAFRSGGLPLPPEWQWYRSHPAGGGPGSPGGIYREANCGIVGGANPALLRHYAHVALDLALGPQNAPAWSAMPSDGLVNMTLEQFLLPACVDYHRFAPASPHRGSYLRYLFPSAADAYDPAAARRAGYTHLLGPAKQHPETMARMTARVAAEDPAFYARCESVATALATATRTA